MRRNKTKIKRIFSTLLSAALVFTMSSYGKIKVYAAEDVEVSGETASDITEVDTENGEIEDEILLSDTNQTFAAWMEETEAEIANADHIIGPNGDISTNNFTLIMPGETIGVRPNWSLSNTGIQGNITKFTYTVSLLDDPTCTTTYLTNASSISKATAFTSIKTRTVTVPYGDRRILEPEGDAVASHTSTHDTFTYTSLYKNNTGLPVVLKGNWYDCPCTESTVYSTIEGKNESDCVNFQGSITYKSKPEMIFLEKSYDLTMDTYCIYDSYQTGSISNVFWPGQVPAKINISHGQQKITFPKPVLKGHKFSKMVFKSDLLKYFENNKVESENAIEYTYNVDEYINQNNSRGVTKIKSNDVSPEFHTGGYLTGEFHGQGGTINGFSSFQFEIVDQPISFDINDCVPVRKGYEFVGWCTDPNTPVIITDTAADTNHDWIKDDNASNFHTDLYAVWKQKASTGTLSTTGIYCSQNYPTIQAGINIQKTNPNDTVEYRWVACNNNNPDKWFEVKPWTKNNNWMSWTPEESGGYVFVCYARIVGNEDATMIQSAFGTEYHKHIKGICQMPYTGEGGGYLIGIESYDNPNHSYKYEMLILDCNLYVQGKDAWVYDTGKCGAPESCLWTIWQPQYGYYWTLFRIYDANDNLIDEACYGFANVN